MSTVHRKFDVSDLSNPHAVTPTDGPISLQPYNSFSATCMRCNYTWNIRVSSIEKAKAEMRRNRWEATGPVVVGGDQSVKLGKRD